MFIHLWCKNYLHILIEDDLDFAKQTITVWLKLCKGLFANLFNQKERKLKVEKIKSLKQKKVYLLDENIIEEELLRKIDVRLNQKRLKIVKINPSGNLCITNLQKC